MNYLVAWKEWRMKNYLHNRNILEETNNIIAQFVASKMFVRSGLIFSWAKGS